MLVFEDVRVVRDGLSRLGPINLTLDPARLTLVLGHNGAGKSLLLRTAHGLLEPDRGSVTWSGRSAQASRATRGFVFQATPVMRRSVAQNVAFPLVARGMGRREIAGRVAEVLELAQLSDWADNPAATLSGGEKQRLAMARALIVQPSTILMDEPAANLDPSATGLLESLIRDAHGAGVGVIMSTHDLRQAARLAEDVVLLENGRVRVQVPAAEFFGDNSPEAARDYCAGHLPERR